MRELDVAALKETVPAKPLLVILITSVPVFPAVTVIVEAVGESAILPVDPVPATGTVSTSVAVPVVKLVSPE